MESAVSQPFSAPSGGGWIRSPAGQIGCKSRAGPACGPRLPGSGRFERVLVDLVLADLPRDAPSREPAELRASSDVPAALLQGLDDVLPLDLLGGDLGVMGERVLHVDFEIG